MVELIHIYVLFPVGYICLYATLCNPTLTKQDQIVDAVVSHVTVNACLQISILFYYDYQVWVINMHGVLGCIDILMNGGTSSLHSEFKLYVGQKKLTKKWQ